MATRNMYIPELGDEVTLAADWTFRLYDESRNETLAEHLGLTFLDPTSFRTTSYSEDGYYASQKKNIQTAVLPAGSVLVVDRIYIRKNASDYSSISFYLKDVKTPARVEDKTIRWTEIGLGNYAKSYSKVVPTKIPAKKVRFWAKLSDVNTMKIVDNS